MTLKTLLKNAGVPKIRGLESKIHRHFWNYYEPGLKANWDKIHELEKLNTELQEQHKLDMDTMRKINDQLKAAEVKLKFTEANLVDMRQRWGQAESTVDDERALVKHLKERIDELDKIIVHQKLYKS